MLDFYLNLHAMIMKIIVFNRSNIDNNEIYTIFSLEFFTLDEKNSVY